MANITASDTSLQNLRSNLELTSLAVVVAVAMALEVAVVVAITMALTVLNHLQIQHSLEIVYVGAGIIY